MRGKIKAALVWGHDKAFIRRTWLQLILAYLLAVVVGLIAYQFRTHSPYYHFTLAQIALNIFAMGLIAQLLLPALLYGRWFGQDGNAERLPADFFYSMEAGFLFILILFWIVRKTIPYPIPKIFCYMLLVIGLSLLGSLFFPHVAMP